MFQVQLGFDLKTFYSLILTHAFAQVAFYLLFFGEKTSVHSALFVRYAPILPRFQLTVRDLSKFFLASNWLSEIWANSSSLPIDCPRFEPILPRSNWLSEIWANSSSLPIDCPRFEPILPRFQLTVRDLSQFFLASNWLSEIWANSFSLPIDCPRFEPILSRFQLTVRDLSHFFLAFNWLSEIEIPNWSNNIVNSRCSRHIYNV